MIGYWHYPVVRPSVCNAVHVDVALGVGVQGKSYTSVFLECMFLFVPSDTFAVGCIV